MYTAATTPRTSPPSHANTGPTVRHAGRARVRGKIRRVWRPRYMQVLDNGHVQYYEDVVSDGMEERGAETATSRHRTTHSSSAWEEDLSLGSSTPSYTAATPMGLHPNQHSMSMPQHRQRLHYKYRLQILHARILDGTTLRDVSVGLPRGTYGWVFRARRLLPVPVDDTTEAPDRGATAESYSAESSSPLATQACLWTPDPCKEDRDFYCAVPHLDAAQMWVVALQWAAAVGTSSGGSSSGLATRDHHYLANSSTHQPTNTPAPPNLVNDDDWEHASYQSSVKAGSRNGGNQDGAKAVPASPTHPLVVAVPATPPSNSRQLLAPPLRPTKSTTIGGGGSTVVTKVMGWRLVRTETFRWTLAYRIDVLKVPRRGQSSTPEPASLPAPRSWTVYRTVDDVEILVESLQRTAVATSTTPIVAGRHPPSYFLKSSTITNATTADYTRGWMWLERLLRQVVIADNATWLQTRAVQQFLGLSSSHPGSARGTRAVSTRDDTAWYTPVIERWIEPWWQIHTGQVAYAAADIDTTAMPISSTTTEHYVKEWLAERPRPHKPWLSTRALGWILSSSLAEPPSSDSHTYFYLYGALAAAGGGILWYGSTLATSSSSSSSSYRSSSSPSNDCSYASVGGSSSASASMSFLPRISIRMDVLVISWVGAAYLGRYFWPRPSPPLPTNIRRQTKHGTRMSNRAKTPRSDGDETPKFGDAGKQKTMEEYSDDDDDDDDSFGDAPAQDDSSALDEALGGEDDGAMAASLLSSPLPAYPDNNGMSCWSVPPSDIFHVRSRTYLQDRVKEPSGPAPLTCRGVDVWMTDTPERNISRHPAVLGGRLAEEDTFLVNFLLPFGNFVAYFGIPPLTEFPEKVRRVWTRFLQGDQEYRDARLKLLPVVLDGPWIVKAAVGPGKSPALLGKAIPLQYFFHPGAKENNSSDDQASRKAVYEVDVIITASTIAKGILSVVKGHTKAVTIAFAFIIEASEEADLPETVLCTFAVHSLHLEACPILPHLSDDSASDAED